MSSSPLNSDHLNVNEIFTSVQGEGTRAGMPCLFIRLQGCRLRCVWCDTPYALDHRQQERLMTPEDVYAEVEKAGIRFVEFTGGEPLEQPAVLPVMQQLCDRGYTVAVETGGHVDVSSVDPRVICIVDVKCPDSKMSSLNRLENLDALRPHDEVKFVIASRADYEYAREVVQRYDLERRVAAVLMSCVFDALAFVTLVEWILEDKLDVRFQLQMHKFIWSPQTRGV
ncbi:MAG TPA: 7-carboxy-7-deazaguanine synthase [Bacteroidetes bacterium]|nr:7-carboxy-7-deazaguanine synthase [Bacteroidota bacterium]